MDFVDNKQPLLYATYAAAFTAFGPSLLAVHAITIPWLLLTAWLVGRLAARLWADETASRVAVVMFTLASVSYVEKDMLSTNTEVLMNLPLVAAFWALASPRTAERRGGPIAAGALMAAAILYNLKAAVALPALAAAAVFAPPVEERWRRAVRLATSLSAVLGLATLWFWQRGALGPFSDMERSPQLQLRRRGREPRPRGLRERHCLRLPAPVGVRREHGPPLDCRRRRAARSTG